MPDVTERGAQVSDDPVSKNDAAPKKVKVEPGDGLHPLPWPYSHGWKVGNLLFIAGQVALDEELRLIGPGDAEEQARQVWRNIKVAVEKAGGKLTDVVRVSTYVADIADIDAIQRARRDFFPDGDYPVATMVEVAKLGLPGLLLETEAIAVIGCS
jgi:2-iminobutanoate/2-iminopropanoate deaminase